jgi:hypothetical protein
LETLQKASPLHTIKTSPSLGGADLQHLFGLHPSKRQSRGLKRLCHLPALLIAPNRYQQVKLRMISKSKQCLGPLFYVYPIAIHIAVDFSNTKALNASSKHFLDYRQVDFSTF